MKEKGPEIIDRHRDAKIDIQIEIDRLNRIIEKVTSAYLNDGDAISKEMVPPLDGMIGSRVDGYIRDTVVGAQSLVVRVVDISMLIELGLTNALALQQEDDAEKKEMAELFNGALDKCKEWIPDEQPKWGWRPIFPRIPPIWKDEDPAIRRLRDLRDSYFNGQGADRSSQTKHFWAPAFKKPIVDKCQEKNGYHE